MQRERSEMDNDDGNGDGSVEFPYLTSGDGDIRVSKARDKTGKQLRPLSPSPPPAPTRSVSMFTCRFWDPRHADFDSELFQTAQSGALRTYTCPFPTCQLGFDSGLDVASHITAVHVETSKRCAACYRTYESLTALMQHYEACRVARSEGFESALDDASGGLISATRVVHARVRGLDAMQRAKAGGIRMFEYSVDMHGVEGRAEGGAAGVGAEGSMMN
jgi:hypothetical protein